MGMLALLKRLAGTDAGDQAVDRRFRERLNGVDEKNEELDVLSDQLDEVIATVGQRQRQIAIHSLPSGASGEHRLDLKRGEDRVRQESDPAIESGGG
jgi:hypothetical protein